MLDVAGDQVDISGFQNLCLVSNDKLELSFEDDTGLLVYMAMER